jgi:hypothetical protein
VGDIHKSFAIITDNVKKVRNSPNGFLSLNIHKMLKKEFRSQNKEESGIKYLKAVFNDLYILDIEKGYR